MNGNELRSQQLFRILMQGLIAITIAVGLAAALVQTSDIVLVLFLGVLFGVFLTRVSGLLSERTPLPYWGSLTATTITLIALSVGCVAMFGVQVQQQVDEVREQVEEGIEQLKRWSDNHPTVKTLMRSTPFLRQLVDDWRPSDADSGGADAGGEAEAKSKQQSSSEKDPNGDSSPQSAARQSAMRSTARRGATAVAGMFTTTFGVVVNTLLIVVIGLFLAASPAQYRDGLVTLFPPQRRERMQEVLNTIGDALWHWLIGRFATMLITGGGAAVLLLVLGVPMALTLGVITALLSFIPNIGAFVALILAMLLATSKGATTVMLVSVGYILLQLVESYLITPLIQQKQTSVPPALLLAFQAIMSVLFGFLGAMVASPLLAATKVGVEELYVKDLLESPN